MGIVLSILIIIGKVLLVILCVLLALILLVLLVPFRYEASGSVRDGDIEGGAKINWLFHFLSFTFTLTKKKGEEKTTKAVFRICGLSPREVRSKRIEKKKEKAKTARKKKLNKLKDADPEEFARLREEARLRKEQRAAEIRKREEEERALREKEEEELKKAENAREKMVIHVRRQLRLIDRLIRTLVLVIHKIFWFVIDGIRSASMLPMTITVSIHKIVSKIVGICDTIAKWKYFVDDPRVRHAFRLIKKRGIKILKAVFPKKLSGEVSFGFEDASTTGEVLAFVSPFYPFYAGKIRLYPDFTQSVLDGELTSSGRIRLGSVGWQVLMLFLSSDVRYTYKTYKALRAESNEEISLDDETDMKEAS